MSEMVERVAKALYGLSFMMDGDECMEAARAALRAMREPTEAMADAGFEVADWAEGQCASAAEDDAFNRCNSVRRYQAMIDAALSEDVK